MLNYQDRYLGLSRILEEVAVAALESGDYYQKLSRLIIANREWFISHVNKLPDCQAFNSRGNFTVVRLKNKTAKALKIALKKEKIIICKFISRNLLRVTVSNPKHTQNFFKLLLRISNAG